MQSVHGMKMSVSAIQLVLSTPVRTPNGVIYPFHSIPFSIHLQQPNSSASLSLHHTLAME